MHNWPSFIIPDLSSPFVIAYHPNTILFNRFNLLLTLMLVISHLARTSKETIIHQPLKQQPLVLNDKTALVEFIKTNLPVSTAEAQEIANRFSPKTLFKNDILLQEGKICDEYCFLVSGFVRAYTFDINGDDITTGFYPANQIVCELFSFFKRVPAKETFQALTDCYAFYIHFNDLQVAFHSMPQFREFGRAILVTAYADLKQRMLSMLHYTAEERYRNLVESSPDIFLHAPLKNVASYLGITGTSLSRIRKEFSRK